MPPRNRPSAFDVSFPGEYVQQDHRPQALATPGASTSAAQIGSRSGSVTSAAPLKRKNEGVVETPRAPSPPPVSYYVRSGLEMRAQLFEETAQTCLPGEDPDGFDDDADVVESKPVRMLTNFSVYDCKHKDEMVPLDVLETSDGAGREMVIVGFAQAHSADLDDEDEGQEEDLEGANDAPVFLKLSAVFKYTINYKEGNDPVHVETQWAVYVLDVPSDAYAPHWKSFMAPKHVAQTVISTASKYPDQSLSTFMDKFTNTVNPFGHTYVESDLWNAIEEMYSIIHMNFEHLKRTTLVKNIFARFQPTKKARVIPSSGGPGVRQMPANWFIGNPDVNVLKAENQNATHVTPRIGKLVKGLVQETLRVIGAEPLPINKVEQARKLRTRQNRIRELIEGARKPKRVVHWEKEDRISPGSQYLTRIYIEGEIYQVGDVILVSNKDSSFWKPPGRHDEPLPLEAPISDLFWFGKIQSLCHDTGMVHLQWFEHGSGILLQELADEQQIYLTNLCTSEKFQVILGKADVRWNVPFGEPLDPHEFACNYMYEGTTGSFTDINSDDLDLINIVRPPDNCPVCIQDEESQLAKSPTKTNDKEGFNNGFIHRGHKFHYGDFVGYYSAAGPARIGFITGFNVNMEATAPDGSDCGFVTCRKVGRITDLGYILPQDVVRDERHLFMTDETVKLQIRDLIGVVFAPSESSLHDRVTLPEWVDKAPNHFYVKYHFPNMRPMHWTQRKRVAWQDHEVCTPCWEEKIAEIVTMKKMSEEHQKRPLKTLDLFCGAGAFSCSLVEGSQALAVSHAVELSPSAARTFKRNSPDTIVYNQCANTMLRYMIKSWEGHRPERPWQLDNSNVPVPLPPAKGEIKVIVAGFPCQAYSLLSTHKKTHDIKYNLILNALSWVDAIRPYYVYFENVNGFLFHRLNGTQASTHRIEGGIEMGGLKILVRALLDMGYQVRFSLLQAVHYGAPQRRIRFFMVAALRGYPLPELPQPSHSFDNSTGLEIKLPYGVGRKQPIRPIRVTKGTALHSTVTIDDAISDLPWFDWKLPTSRPRPRRYRSPAPRSDDSDGTAVPIVECMPSQTRWGVPENHPYRHKPKTRYQLEARSKPTRNLQHFTRRFKAIAQIKRVLAIPLKANANHTSLRPRDQEWQTSNALSSVGRKNYRSSAYGRLDKDGVFPTIITNINPTAKQGQVLNPYCKRIVTVRELARAQGFPDHFVFESIGDFVVTMHRQIGNAVPWPLGRALGRELRIALMQKWNKDHRSAIEVDDDSDGEDVVMRDGSETSH